jgi:hypothetical protein
VRDGRVGDHHHHDCRSSPRYRMGVSATHGDPGVNRNDLLGTTVHNGKSRAASVLSQSPYGLPLHYGLAAIRNWSQVCGDFLRKPCMHLQDHHVSSTKFSWRNLNKAGNFQTTSIVPWYHQVLAAGPCLWQVPRAIMRRPAEWAAGGSIPSAAYGRSGGLRLVAKL